eukprot:1247880-Pleurochrysis_carterae.AAC.3
MSRRRGGKGGPNARVRRARSCASQSAHDLKYQVGWAFRVFDCREARIIMAHAGSTANVHDAAGSG